MQLKKVFGLAAVATALLAGGVTATAATGTDATPAAGQAVNEDGEFYSPVTAADIQQPWAYVKSAPTSADAVSARTADQAVNWYSSRAGSSQYEGYCEMAARLSWDRVTHHASAIEHWQSSDGARHTSGAAPRGAFVFWNISAYGHVGISDGNGGFWATDVNGAIGHANSVNYFNNYLGWKPGNSN